MLKNYSQGCILPPVPWAMARVEFLSTKEIDEKFQSHATSNIIHAYLSQGQRNFDTYNSLILILITRLLFWTP